MKVCDCAVLGKKESCGMCCKQFTPNTTISYWYDAKTQKVVAIEEWGEKDGR